MIATTVINSMRVNPARFTSAQGCKRRAAKVLRAARADVWRLSAVSRLSWGGTSRVSGVLTWA